MRDDHLGSLSIDLVALAKCTAEQFLLGEGAPGQGRDDPRQCNKESRPAAESERFAHGEQSKAQIDGVSHDAIRAACDETGALICFGREAPSGTKLGMAMRATFQDRETAALMGVPIQRIHTATFALGSGLAAAAGALLGPIFLVTP